MASDAESLSALETLMNEFFAPTTSNERKREIESVLHNFSSQQGAWKHCIYFMSHSNNQYVCMYSLTTIETLITKQWLGLMWEERAQLRSTLYQFALEHHHTSPNFIRNKLVKLVVDIARLDWPHFYPDFFTNVLLLIQNPETTSLGLVFLQTASEELVCPWEDLSFSRKEELRRLLLAHIPQVFSILTNVLERIAQKKRHGVTATPPPSPTHGQPNSNSPVHSGSLLSSMLGNGKNLHSTIDTDSDAVCCLALQALTHLFSWVPLSSYITPNLITVLFQLANITQSPSRDEGQCIGTLAMSAINEIMYKNCVPASCEDFLLNVFQQAMHILSNLIQSGGLDQVDEGYQEKLTEFLRVFVGFHMRRLESNPKFSSLELLSLLFKYTFQPLNLDHYYSCLEVWHIFLDHLHNQQDLTERYHKSLVILINQVLWKIQFKYNQSELEILDDKTLDDDEQTEWQKFLRQNIEIVAKAAELAPLETYTLGFEAWKEAANVYLQLEEAFDATNQRLSVSREDSLLLHCLMRDLSSLTQAMGRMYPHFIGPVLMTRFSHAEQLMMRLVAMATYGTRVQLHRVQVSPEILIDDFVEVNAQVLAALKAWCHWLVALHSESNLKHMYREYALQIVQSVCPILSSPGEPVKLYHSAAHLLVTVTSTVRPAELWELKPICELYHIAPTMAYLQPETQRLVWKALCNSLLLPSVEVQNQNWEQRHKLLSSLLHSLTSDFQHLVTGAPHSHSIITSTLTLLGDLVEGTKAEGSNTRKLLFTVIQGSIHHALTLFPAYVRVPDVCEVILDFFLTAFAGLQQQLGASFTESTVQTFLDLFTREQLSSSLDEGGAGTRVVDKFLRLLQLVIAEPGAAFKRFVPSTITLCLEHVYPLVAESASPDIKPALFGLLHCIMFHKWQYFYTSNVLQSLNQSGGEEPINHREQFTAVLRAYGQSLLQPDINVFGQNLRSLEQLNSRWKLYHKVLFRQELLAQFLTVLLHSLIHKSHALLEEDITVAIYNMATVSFDAFYNEFLTEFLRSNDGLDNSQRSILQRNFKQELDLPSFTQNVQRLVNDLRCYKLCNASLPANSVKL